MLTEQEQAKLQVHIDAHREQTRLLMVELEKSYKQANELGRRIEEFQERMVRIEDYGSWISAFCDQIEDDDLRFQMRYRAEQVIAAAFTDKHQAKRSRAWAEETYEVAKEGDGASEAMESVAEMVDKWATIIAALLCGYGVTGAGFYSEAMVATAKAIGATDPDKRDWTADDVRAAYAKLERIEAKAKERGLL